MYMADVKEVMPSLNSRSDAGRVVINPPSKMAGPLELHTTDQIRLCCNRAFLTFESYLKHKEESPCCSPGIILEPIAQDRLDDSDEETGLFPIIQSVSTVAEDSLSDENDHRASPAEDEIPAVSRVKGPEGFSVISEALRRLSMTPRKPKELQGGPPWTATMMSPSPLNQTSTSVQHFVDPIDIKYNPDRARFHQDISEGEEDQTNVYECHFENCSFSAETEGDLEYHFENHHNSPDRFSCHICSDHFENQDRLSFHLKQNHYSETIDKTEVQFEIIIVNNRKRYKCLACNYLTPGESHVVKHIQSAHECNGKFLCKICPCRYTLSTSLTQHIRLLHPNATPLERSEVGMSNLPRFRTILVGGRTRYKCITCGFSALNKVTLKNHIKQFHTKNSRLLIEKLSVPSMPVYVNNSKNCGSQSSQTSARIFSCRICPNQYLSRKHLDDHVQLLHHVTINPTENEVVDHYKIPEYEVVIINRSRQFKCKGCAFITTTLHNIKRHVEGAHVPDGKYSCTLCSCRYKQKDRLTQHMKFLHSDRSNQTYTKVVAKDGSTSFKCDSCSYKSARKSSTVNHVTTAHVPDGEFSCPVCCCCFAKKVGLTKHVVRYHPKVDLKGLFRNKEVLLEPSVSTQKDSNSHKCTVKGCVYKCWDIRNLRYHQKVAHNPTAKFPCQFCSCRYEHQAGLSNHLGRLHKSQLRKTIPKLKIQTKENLFVQYIRCIQDKQITYKCSVKDCVFRTTTTTQMKWHAKKGHSLSRKFGCSICSWRFTVEQRLHTHIKQYHAAVLKPNTSLRDELSSEMPSNEISEDTLVISGKRKTLKDAENLPCPIQGCPLRMLQQDSAIKKHLRGAHSPEAKFKCSFCPCRYHKARSLKHHLTWFHKNMKKAPLSSQDLRTNEISKKRLDESSLPVKCIKISSLNNVDRHKCKCPHAPQCSFVADGESSITNHLKRAHVPDGPHKCPRCPCRFATSVGLFTHLHRLHKLKKSKTGVTKAALTQPRIFKSSQSDKPSEAVSPAHLPATIITPGRKPYTCNLCDRSFLNAVSRKWHIKCAHSKWISNVKRYPCDLCPNVYDSEGGLKIHRSKTHAIYQQSRGTSSSPQKKNNSIDMKVVNTPVKSVIIAEQNKGRKSIESGISMFQCTKCEFSTPDNEKLDEHNNGWHVKDGLKCVWCPCTFPTKMSLVLHQNADHPNSYDTTGVNWFQRKTGITRAGTKLSVDDNDDESKSNSAKEDHDIGSNATPISNLKRRRHHITNRKLYRCHKCPYITKDTKAGLLHTQIAHWKNGFKCSHCPCSFASIQGLRCHQHLHKKCRMKIKSNAIGRFRMKISKDPPAPEEGKKDPNEHLSLKNKGLKFSPKSRPMGCSDCGKICHGPENLKAHQKEHHETADESENCEKNSAPLTKKASSLRSAGHYRCDECPRTFKETTELSNHKRIQHPDNKEIETACDEEAVIENIEKYNYDELQQNEVSKIYHCNLCEYTTEILCNIHSHFRTSHTKGEFSCDECSCVFEARMSLFNHKKYFHSNEKSENFPKESRILIGYAMNGNIRCSYCLDFIKSVKDLESHYVETHQNLNSEKEISPCQKSILQIANSSGTRKLCMKAKPSIEGNHVLRKIHSCGAVFSNSSDAEECDICKKKFRKSHLLRHMQLCHTSISTGAQCDECACKYSTKSALQKHVAWSHKLKFPQPVVAELAESKSLNDTNKKPFKCQKCGLRFALTTSLDVHLKVSHASGRHACVICSCTFETLFGLDGHIIGAHELKRDGLFPVKLAKIVDESKDPGEKEILNENPAVKELNKQFEDPSENSNTAISESGQNSSTLDRCDTSTNLSLVNTDIDDISSNASNASAYYAESSERSETSGRKRLSKRKYLDKLKCSAKKAMSRSSKSSVHEESETSDDVRSSERIHRQTHVKETKSKVGSVVPTADTEILADVFSAKTSPSKDSVSNCNLEQSDSVSSVFRDEMISESSNKRASETESESRNDEEIVGKRRFPQRKSAKMASKLILDIMSDTQSINDIPDVTEITYPNMGPPPKRPRASAVSRTIRNDKTSETAAADAAAETIDTFDIQDTEIGTETTGNLVAETEKITETVSENFENHEVEIIRSPKRKRAQTASKITETVSESLENPEAKITETVSESLENPEAKKLRSPKRKAAEIIRPSNRKIAQIASKITETVAENLENSEVDIIRPSKKKSAQISSKMTETVSEHLENPEVEIIEFPKRKSAQIASKIILNLMNEERMIRKRTHWLKEFMKFVCSRCGSTFVSNSDLTVHFQGCEENCTKFSCGICSNVFPTLLKLKEHLWKIHKPGYSKILESSTSSSSKPKGPQTAKDRDTPKAYSCSLCKLGLKDRKSLILHMSVPHLFRCKKCAYVCSTKPLMEVHKLEFHKSNLPALTTTAQNSGTGKNSTAKIRSLRTCKCGTKFSKPSEYEYHKQDCKGVAAIEKVPGKSISLVDPQEIVIVYEQTTIMDENKPNSSAPPAKESTEEQVDDYDVADENSMETSTTQSEHLQDSLDEEATHNFAGQGKNLETDESEFCESMICQDCGYLAFSVEDARDHNSSVGNNESMICDVCAYLASSSCDFKLHAQSNHTDVQVGNEIEYSGNLSLTEQEITKIMVEFHGDSEMNDLDEGSHFLNNMVQEIEVREESSNDNGESSEAVVLFNISDFQTILYES